MVMVAEDRGAEMEGRNWPPSLHKPAEPQFRLLHPQVRLKQQYLRLATVTGAGRKKSYARLSGYLQIHHFVCPPFASTTAWQRSFIFPIYLVKSDSSNAAYSFSMYCLNSARVRGNLLVTLCFNRRQTFSIGFKSEELAGQHILSISFRL